MLVIVPPAFHRSRFLASEAQQKPANKRRATVESLRGVLSGREHGEEEQRKSTKKKKGVRKRRAASRHRAGE